MGGPYFSLILWLLRRNIPLGHVKQWTEERIEREGKLRGMCDLDSDKGRRRAARIIVGGCSQYDVAAQMVQEWELLGPGLRTCITQFANENSHSGNVRKGLLYADKLLRDASKGRISIFSRVPERDMVRDLQRRGSAYGVRDRREVLPAVSGASRAFAAFTLPKDYRSWSPARKKAFREQQARDRRESRANRAS